MSAHTPGPWIARFAESGGYDCMTDAWHIGDGIRGIAMVDLGSYGQTTDGKRSGNAIAAEADARLIAATTDLLASLCEFIALYDGVRDSLGQSVREKLARAEAAVAKTEGR